MSGNRQLAYFWQHHILRRSTLMAEDLPLGLSMKVHAPDDVGRRLFKYRVHEPQLLRWLESRPAPREGALALDVGANIGWYSLVLDRLAGNTLQVHAFEPDPGNRALLQENVDLNRAASVRVSDLALGDVNGPARLNRYRDINQGKHSLLPLEGCVGSISVPVTTLDTYLAESNLTNADIWLLKLDVEGHEPAVIRGARAALARVGAIILEYSPMYYVRQEAQKMLAALWATGLRPRWLDRDEWVPVAIPQLLALQEQRDTVWCRDQPGVQGGLAD